jgi:hypothetical protein
MPVCDGNDLHITKDDALTTESAIKPAGSLFIREVEKR